MDQSNGQHSMKREIDLVARPVHQETLTAGQYLKLSEADRRKILEIDIVPPKLGLNHFGGLLVRYKTPIYKVG